MRRWMVVAVAGALVASAGGVAAPASAAVRYVDQLFPGYAKTADIAYGAAPNSTGAVQTLTLDVYKPGGDTATNRALYIWVHGGNFRVGDKSSAGPLPDYVRRGWVGISINYRLRPELPGNAALGAISDPTSLPPFIDAVQDAQHDAQAAIRWARANAASLGIDATRIAIGGISAGAITSLMVAFNPKDPGTSGNPGQPSDVAAAVSHAGTYAPVLLGDAPVAGSPPIAIYHGTNDEQVPYLTAPLPCVLTLLRGNDCEFVTFIAQGHQTMGTDLARDFLYRHVILDRTALRTPLITVNDADNLGALAGVEPPNVDLGLTVGVVTPKDPQVIIDETVQLVEYSLNALGITLP
ncbi:MAG TPA: alpha/beta hydrolase [Acidimicrobiales bacterium]|nr:alpha/beta hydrolase [Acidimicrobiales bacterium]